MALGAGYKIVKKEKEQEGEEERKRRRRGKEDEEEEEEEEEKEEEPGVAELRAGDEGAVQSDRPDAGGRSGSRKFLLRPDIFTGKEVAGAGPYEG
ncbi:hypothetical protein H920_12222 [Fukomys damarensis]|uniref:Uncharacterized protein n=1 Tax=Fukomys damarensis TaxID=885580 RepID=A0A091D830_FUKDA|nr:hypothetical protein H920_12222 [Fukomys damarensis]